MAQPIVLIAHNIRSIWNIGTLFRTGDAFGVDHIHLTGYTAQPPRKEISKTALGAEKWIPWSYTKDPLEVIEKRREEGFMIVALEKNDESIAINTLKSDKPICLIIGHEVLGVNEDLLKASDTIAHIAMQGKKESLNVSVATGIALYAIRSLENLK
ncbi:MAG: RNA methyltransferase [Candidatus Peribacteraceae bacterium]|nr:RNA methyltransferase [Candidatus Peribacteraceae bacterium]